MEIDEERLSSEEHLSAAFLSRFRSLEIAKELKRNDATTINQAIAKREYVTLRKVCTRNNIQGNIDCLLTTCSKHFDKLRYSSTEHLKSCMRWKSAGVLVVYQRNHFQRTVQSQTARFRLVRRFPIESAPS